MDPVRVTCDGCGANLRVASPTRGGSGACPRCGAPITVPPAPHDEVVTGNQPVAGRTAAPRLRTLMMALNSAAGALVVCGTLAVGVVVSGYVTPRLTGRYEDAPPSSVTLPAEPPHAVCERDGGRRPGVVEGGSRDPAAGRPAALPAVLSQLMPPGGLTTRADWPSPRTARVTPGPIQASSTADGDVPPPAPRPPARAGKAQVRTDAPPPPAAAAADNAAKPEATAARRIRVRTPAGRTVIARVHGVVKGETHVMLPDGQLAIADAQAFTDEPFRPATAEEILSDLRSGPFEGFETKTTEHYVILYRSTEAFADESAKVLESLYRNLLEAFRKRDVPVHEAEFPLVAVIFRTEAEFRAHKRVDPAVQAYYELFSNRIYFYQTSERDQEAPEIAALRRPQTVAHEGTHQVLQNVGIQPRLAAWPAWLVEGLAEYCAAPQTTRRGATWAGLGVVNAQHLATIRDLEDPLSGQVPGATRPEHIGRPPGMPLVEYMITKTELSPTDYALAWAMTHYLAMKRVDEFLDYLKTMSLMPPLSPRTGADHLAVFRAAFGTNLAKLDREIGTYLSKLKAKDHLPYYSVMFQQRIPGGMVKRAAIVSQSPSMIRQWLETVTSPRGEPPAWDAVPFNSRTRAYVAAEEFIRGL